MERRRKKSVRPEFCRKAECPFWNPSKHPGCVLLASTRAFFCTRALQERELERLNTDAPVDIIRRCSDSQDPIYGQSLKTGGGISR